MPEALVRWYRTLIMQRWTYTPRRASGRVASTQPAAIAAYQTWCQVWCQRRGGKGSEGDSAVQGISNLLIRLTPSPGSSPVRSASS